MIVRHWNVDQDHDVRVASWRVAELIYGPDDGSMDRDAIECEIQEVIARSFDFTHRAALRSQLRSVIDGRRVRSSRRSLARAIMIKGKIVSPVDGFRARFEKPRRMRSIGFAPWKPLPPIIDDPDWDVETFANRPSEWGCPRCRMTAARLTALTSENRCRSKRETCTPEPSRRLEGGG